MVIYCLCGVKVAKCSKNVSGGWLQLFWLMWKSILSLCLELQAVVVAVNNKSFSIVEAVNMCPFSASMSLK